MGHRVSKEEQHAVHGIFAAGLGILLHYIRSHWYCASVITGFSFEIIYWMVLYIYLPFVLSLVYASVLAFAAEVLRDRNQISIRTFFLIMAALLAAGCVIFGLQEGAVLIISVVLLVFRIIF